MDELILQLTIELSTISSGFEIVLVDDRRSDKSRKKILENCKKDTRVRGIQLSRDFGQHHAITAGLDYLKEKEVVVPDCGLQDNPVSNILFSLF